MSGTRAWVIDAVCPSEAPGPDGRAQTTGAVTESANVVAAPWSELTAVGDSVPSVAKAVAARGTTNVRPWMRRPLRTPAVFQTMTAPLAAE